MNLIFRLALQKTAGPLHCLSTLQFHWNVKLLSKMILGHLSSWTFNNSSVFRFSADNFTYYISGGNRKSKRTTSFYHHQIYQLTFPLDVYSIFPSLMMPLNFYPPLLLLLFSSSFTANLDSPCPCPLLHPRSFLIALQSCFWPPLHWICVSLQ